MALPKRTWASKEFFLHRLHVRVLSLFLLVVRSPILFSLWYLIFLDNSLWPQRHSEGTDVIYTVSPIYFPAYVFLLKEKKTPEDSFLCMETFSLFFFKRCQRLFIKCILPVLWEKMLLFEWNDQETSLAGQRG